MTLITYGSHVGQPRVTSGLVLMILASYSLHTPPRLLRLIASYLTERSLIVNYLGVESNFHELPGSLAQGDELGLVLCLVAIAEAGTSENDTEPSNAATAPTTSELPKENSIPTPPITDKELRLKFVDDLSLGEVINLKEQLRKNNEVERPSNFHERNELYLPKENSLVKSHLNKLEEYVDMEGMEIQHKRTCIQTFNIS